jgi:hypothetical protein
MHITCTVNDKDYVYRALSNKTFLKKILQLGSIFVIVLCLTPFLIYKENQIDNLFILFLHFRLATIKRTGLYVHCQIFYIVL